MARKEDPMSSLLNDVGGIDAGLFQKRQSMRDMRPGAQAATSPVPRPSAAPQQQQPQQQAQSLGAGYGQQAARSFRGPALQSSPAQTQPAGNKGRADGNRQLDALLGGDVLPKSNRPMREAAKPARPASNEPWQPEPRPRSTTEASTAGTATPQVAPSFGSLGQDLDSVFGGPSAPAQQQATAGDPFAAFGDLGTTQAAPPPPSVDDGDLLSDFASSPGTTRQASARSLAAPQGAAHRRAVGSGGGSDDWGGMTAASPGLSSPAYSSALEDDFSSPTRPAAAREQPASPPRPPPEAPPPSYESVMRGSGRRSGSLSPRPRQQRYQAWQDEGAEREEVGGRSRPPRSPVGGRPAPQQEQIRDQAKQWLSAGQKWLSGAGRKVAAAVKETQAQISSRLEELDSKAEASRRGGAGEPGRPQQPSGGAGGGSGHSRGQGSLEGVPAYYFDWAETIRKLPAHEQGPTLAAMPDEDANVIQRILRRPPGGALPESPPPRLPPQPQPRRAFSGELPDQQAPPQPRPRRSGSAELRASDADSPPRRTRQPRPSEGRREEQRPAPRQPGPLEAGADLMGLSEARPPRARQPAAEADLMGLSSDRPAQAPASARKPDRPAAPAGEAGADLLGLSGEPVASPASAAAASPGPAADLFGSPAGPRQGVHDDLEAMFNAQPQQARGAGGAGGSMIDFGLDEGGPDPEWLQPSGRDAGQEGEPEARKVARARRLADTRARMQRQLAEKQARDAAEAAQQEAQADLRTRHRERIEAWKAGKKDNIRALLGSLHTVLWPDSGWSQPGMADLVEAPRVKRWYMKANLVVHPDKVRQKGGSVEQIVVADMAFDTLKVAWARFEATELRGR